MTLRSCGNHLLSDILSHPTTLIVAVPLIEPNILNKWRCKERRGHRSCVNGHVTGPTDLRAEKRKKKITKKLQSDNCPFTAQWSLYVRPVKHSAILRSAHTLYLYVLCGSQNKQPLFPYTTLTDWFAGAFAKLRKPTVIIVMSVCPSVSLSLPIKQLDFHRMDFLGV